MSQGSDNIQLKGGLVEVSVEQVEELAASIIKREDEYDVLSEISPISVQMFWDNFFADNAKFSLAHFLEEIKEKNIVMGKWEPWEEDKENPVEEGAERIKRELNFTCAIKGVPFCSSSRWIKSFTCVKSASKIENETQVRTPDVPYGDYFYLNERWVVGSPVPNGNRIYFKIFISVKIVKKTFFQK